MIAEARRALEVDSASRIRDSIELSGQDTLTESVRLMRGA